MFSGPLREAEKESGAGGGQPDFAALIRSALAEGLAPLKADIDALKKTSTPPPDTKKEDPPPPPPPDANKDFEGLPPAVRALLADSKRESDLLKKRLETIETQKRESDERAESSSRESAVTTALSGHEWIDNEAQALIKDRILNRVKRDQDGTLTVDGLPVPNYLKQQLEGPWSFALKVAGAGGTGATRGSGSGKKVYSMDDIKPGMTATEKNNILSHISSQITRR